MKFKSSLNYDFIISLILLFFVQLSLSADSIISDMPKNIDKDNTKNIKCNVTKSDYLNVVVNTFKTQNILTSDLENELTLQASNIIEKHINANGGKNTTSYKFNVFKNLFPSFISLKRIGLKDNLAKFKQENAVFFPKYLETGLVLFLSRKPFSKAERKELKELLSKLKAKYIESIGVQYSDYKRLANECELRNLVSDHIDNNITYTIENYFDIDSCYFSINNLKNQLDEDLPMIKPTFPNAGKLWLKKLEKSNLPRSTRASFENMYKSVISNEFKETMNEWEKALFIRNRHCDKGFKILSRKVPGISINTLYPLLVQHAKAWSLFMKQTSG